MEYKIGQAAITEYGDVAFITEQTKTTYNYVMLRWSDIRLSVGKTKFKRPATEAEILAEIQKHGWELADIEYITGKHINLIKTNQKGWVYGGGSSISTENLKELSEEGLQAHTIITALKLANV
jgi:hypothetical protein